MEIVQKTLGMGWIRGREGILAYLGSKSWNSVRYMQSRGLPIRHLPNTSPVLIPFEADQWLIAWDDMKREKARKKKEREEQRQCTTLTKKKKK